VCGGGGRHYNNSLGRARKSTTSASICWIWLIICIRMSRVSSLSVLCASHNIIGWYLHFGLWRCIKLYDELFFALAYPSVCLLYVLHVWFSLFWDDNQFIDVSRCEKHPWSSGWWRFCRIAYLGWIPLFWAFLQGYGPCTVFSF